MNPTNDAWVWILFYSFFLFMICSTVIVSIKRKRLRKVSFRAFVATIFLFALFSWNAMYRNMTTEFGHFFDDLTSLRPWAWMCIYLFAYILKWWYLVFLHSQQNLNPLPKNETEYRH